MSRTRPNSLFNVQTIDPETGSEGWVTVQAADAEAARSEAGQAARAQTGVSVIIGEVRRADARVAARAAADEDFDAIPLEPENDRKSTKPCAVCRGPMAHDSRVCGICGYDERVGFESSTYHKPGRAGKGAKCGKCGYDLAGLANQVCPECGTDNSRADLGSHWVDHIPPIADRLSRWKPVIVLAIGLGVSLAVGLATGTMRAEVILHGSMIPLGFLVAAMCTLMWIGNDTTWGMLFLRVAAIYAFTHAIGSGLRSLLGAQFLVSGVQIFVTMFVAVWLMDFDDMIDGAILGIALWITWFFATLFLFQVVLAP